MMGSSVGEESREVGGVRLSHWKVLRRQPTRTDFGFNSILLSHGFELGEFNARGVQNKTIDCGDGFMGIHLHMSKLKRTV